MATYFKGTDCHKII